jgi:hypothetical protein
MVVPFEVQLKVKSEHVIGVGDGGVFKPKEMRVLRSRLS